MLFISFGVYEDVIDKFDYKLIKEGLEYPIHYIHKEGWGIS